VRIPEDIEQGEHTIELRAVTKRAKVVTVSVPAIVLGTNDNSTDDTVATTLPISTTTLADTEVIDDTTTQSTAPAATSVEPIRVKPGATEVALPSSVVISVVNEILGDVSAAGASVRVRVSPQPWQTFDLENPTDLVLPLAKDSEALEIEVTPEGGQPITRSIALQTPDEGGGKLRVALWLVTIIVLLGSFWLIVMKRRQRDDEETAT